MGILFNIVGVRATLLYFSIGTFVIQVIFTAFILISGNVDDYEHLSESESEIGGDG